MLLLRYLFLVDVTPEDYKTKTECKFICCKVSRQFSKFYFLVLHFKGTIGQLHQSGLLSWHCHGGWAFEMQNWHANRWNEIFTFPSHLIEKWAQVLPFSLDLHLHFSHNATTSPNLPLLAYFAPPFSWRDYWWGVR